jgi:iron complex outermembrane receptor protein
MARKICNSASDSNGGALGGSVFFDQGYLGASVSQFNSNYGTVAEDTVTIRMKSERYAIAGELRGLSGPFQSVKLHLGQNTYAHTEFEGPDPGTVFKSSGNDLRLEARHVSWGGLDGILGLQTDTTDFSAAGEEAFAPFSRTRQTALFSYEEVAFGWGRLSAGLRLEDVNVESFGNPEIDRFAIGTRSFKPVSSALGALWNVAPGWALTSNLAYSERAPKDYELFANGPHLATDTYEVGDTTLALERSTNLDMGLQWKSGANRFAVSAFVNQFSNYISQVATGAQQDDVDVYAFTQVKARFTGLEASGNLRLLEGKQTLDLELHGDLVRASNSDNGEALPRIAPVRVGATLLWTQGHWNTRVGFNRSAAQTAVPPGQLATEAYTLWTAAASYTTKSGPTQLLWFARLDNATDALAYSASSVLTQTVPGKAPLPGRNVKLGLQISF